MKFLSLISLLFVFPLYAHDSLVFMRENAQGKHIVLKINNQETQLTHSRNWHLYPDLSSDGKKVVWVEGPNNKNLNVVVYDLASKSKDKFELNRRGQNLQPRFSKNGKKVFFSGVTSSGNKIMFFEPENSRSRVDRREADGTRIYKLAPQMVPHDGSGYFPRPSSNGDMVIFQRTHFLKREIVEYNFITKKSRVLAEGMAPALSFDENWVAYTSKQNGSWDIWITNRATGDKVALTNDAKDEMAPSFTPDGQVVFASNRNGRFQIYKLFNGQWEELATSQSDDYAPQISGESAWQLSFRNSFPAPARSSFGSIAQNGKIYICAGHQGAEHTYPPESFTDYLQVFDPQSGSWNNLAPRPHKAHGFQMAAFGKYLYAFGGFAYDEKNSPKWKSIDVIDRYNIESNTWETIGHMPRRRSSNQAVTVGTKVYLIGGWDATPKSPGDFEGTFHAAVDEFDLLTEEITTARWEIPLPLRRAFTAIENNGNIIMVGGLGVGASHFELLNNVTLIEPTSGFHKELPALPFATFAPAAGILDGELLVFGGMFKTGEMNYEYVSHIYGMNLSTQKWRHTGRYLSETKGFSQVTPFENGLAILGGHRYFEDRDEPVTTFEFITR